MKNALPLLVFALSLNAYAAAPKVSCGAMAYETNADGSTILDSIVHSDNVIVTEAGIDIATGKGRLKSRLNQICASDGGPSSDRYDLETTLTIGDSSSYTSSTLGPDTEKYFRQHLSLKAGNLSIFVNCDKDL